MLPVLHPSAVLLAHQQDISSVTVINKQIVAILRIAKSPQKGDVTLLIPFLDYTTSPIDAIFSIAPTLTEDLQKTKENWPAFAAILNNPYAKDELKAYVLDNTHLLDTRLAAWLILRYVDKEAFADIAKSIDSELMHANPQVRNYASGIENGTVRFEGIPYTEYFIAPVKT